MHTYYHRPPLRQRGGTCGFHTHTHMPWSPLLHCTEWFFAERNVNWKRFLRTKHRTRGHVVVCSEDVCNSHIGRRASALSVRFFDPSDVEWAQVAVTDSTPTASRASRFSAFRVRQTERKQISFEHDIIFNNILCCRQITKWVQLKNIQ